MYIIIMLIVIVEEQGVTAWTQGKPLVKGGFYRLGVIEVSCFVKCKIFDTQVSRPTINCPCP
jgi:hypothetical protein